MTKVEKANFQGKPNSENATDANFYDCISKQENQACSQSWSAFNCQLKIKEWNPRKQQLEQKVFI